MSNPDSQILIELVKAIPNVVTAITAVVGVTIAARGLNKWRSETIGKRKAELAEDVLADFYQARDIIAAARSPGTFEHEGKTREKGDWETEDDEKELNAYFATVERLNNKSEFFAQLHARRYRFIAYFGQAAVKPYDELHKIYVEIVVAVRMLLSTHRNRAEGSLPKGRKKWRKAIWEGEAEGDAIPSKLNEIVADIELICRPAITERH